MSESLKSRENFVYLAVLVEEAERYEEMDEHMNAHRTSRRIVSSIERKEEKTETECAKICEDTLNILDKHLIPRAASGESKVFCHKMMGDYHSSLTDLAESGQRVLARLSMLTRLALALTELPSCASYRSWSCIFPCITRLDRACRACRLAKQAFDDAIAMPELDPLSEESYKDSSLSMDPADKPTDKKEAVDEPSDNQTELIV
ncbi:14-3-3 domain-containing protein [Lentinula raphanica]|nr:14-3-3 domain-containing protein [Lentinula raphanica]